MRITLLLLLLAACSSNPKANNPTSTSNPKPAGEIKLDCPQGTKQFEYELRYWCVTPDMTRNGPTVLYSSGGQILEEGSWRENAPVGLWTYHDKSGKQIAQIDMKEGDGVWPSFYDTGAKASEQNYKAGKLEGAQTNWSVSGQITYQATHKDGRLDGLVKSFFNDGKPSVEANYLEGEQHGDFHQWNEAGEKVSDRKYHYGTQIEETIYEKGVAKETKKTPIPEPTYQKVVNKEHPKIKREWQACQEHSQCRQVSTRCCACGAQDSVAVHYKFAQDAQKELLPLSSCNDKTCPSQMCQQVEAICLENLCATAE
jgi:antitoxin component YwqK of YwqJK toxin-antitoxin module